MLQPTEQWLSVVGFEGHYEVSDLGQVRSLKRGAPRLKASGGDGPYRGIQLCRDGQRFYFRVHQLVAAAFIGPCPPGLEVRHLDGNPVNNRADNLAYGTKSENGLDRTRHGTQPKPRTHCRSGHAYTEENTRIRVRKGRRFQVCRECHRRQRRESQARARRCLTSIA